MNYLVGSEPDRAVLWKQRVPSLLDVKPRLHQIHVAGSRTSNLYPDTSGYNLHPGYMY